MNVPWISKEKIALKALGLIENFQALAEYEVKPPIPVPETSIDLEQHLETWIENDPALVQAGLEIVGRQMAIDGGRLDLLAIDPLGRP